MIISSVSAKHLLPIGKKIVEGLEDKKLKFFMPFIERSMINRPKNAVTGYEYSGVNFWNLSFIQFEEKFKTPLFATKSYWDKVGAVIPEENEKKGFPVFYWGDIKKNKKSKKVDQDEDEKKKYSYMKFLKVSWVFNADQVDLSNSTWTYPKNKKTVNKVKTDDKIENFVNNQKGLELKHSNEAKCYYSPTLDYVHMSNKSNFIDTEHSTAHFEYYSTLLHELIHWTGHDSRTGRFKRNEKHFKEHKRKQYALEELNAEIGATILCIQFGLQKSVNKNSLAYIQSWKKYLSDDAVFIYKALTNSALAVDFLEKNLKENKAVKTA